MQRQSAAIRRNQTQSDETPSSVPPRNQTQSVTRFLRRSQGHSSQSDTTIRRDSFVGPSSQSDAIRCIRDTLSQPYLVSLIMLAFRFEHDSSEPHPLLTFEVKSKRLLCINCKTEELYEATYHAEVLQTGYIMYTRTPHLEHLKDTVQIRRPYVWLRAHLTLGLGKPGRPNTGARCMAVSTLITSYDFGAPAHASSHEPARPCGAAGRGSGRGEREPRVATVDARGCVHAARCRVQGGDAGGAGVAGACAARGPRHCWAWYVHWYYSRQASLSLLSRLARRPLWRI